MCLLSSEGHVRQNCLEKPVLQCMLNVYEFLARFKAASVRRKHGVAGDGAVGKSFVGVISDTHGLVRPQALAALAGAERSFMPETLAAPQC